MCAGEISEYSVIDWFNLFRDLMIRYQLEHPLRLGGPGETVQIDKSLLRGKRKYNVGRAIPNYPWVFGAIQESTQKMIVAVVPDRTGGTLKEKITTYILPGTRIISDQWAGYNGITAHPNNYTRLTVNHTENYVDPATGAHTQRMEGFWGNAKGHFKAMHGVTQDLLGTHLDEMTFRWNHRDVDMMDKMLELMAMFYPCGNRNVPTHLLANMPQVHF